MVFLHLSDLHLGRRFHDVSLLEDQKYILQQILDLLDAHGADAVLLAGDLYDKPVPPAEAVQLLDWFMNRLSERGLPVFLVSGNHDSPERLAFGSRLMSRSGIYISPVFDGVTEPVRLHDRFGEVRIYLLPFVKPIHVRRVFPEAEICTYTDAVKAVVDAWQLDTGCRNVLVAHQLVTGAQRSESEAISIGGLDDVSGDVLERFDYVALGHLHRAQPVHREHIRYCGTPLAYSFSEGDREKTVTWVELGEKGHVNIARTALRPLRAAGTLRGRFEELMAGASEDYVRIILTDTDDTPDALARLRRRYPNLLRLEYDNLRTRADGAFAPVEAEEISPLQLLENFYELRNNQPMGAEQVKLAKAWMEEIWEGDA